MGRRLRGAGPGALVGALLLAGAAVRAAPAGAGGTGSGGHTRCQTPTRQHQAHVRLPSSSAWLHHGFDGAVLDVTGDIVAVQTRDGTVATAYAPGLLAGVQPGERVAVAGTMRDGLVYAQRLRVTGGTPWPAATTPAQPEHAIHHVVFVVQENHSLDNYFGTYPGTRGLRRGERLPARVGGPRNVAPFHLTGPLQRDLAHTWRAAHASYDGGALDGFVYTDGTKDAMGYYTGREIPNYWRDASRYALADEFFASVMGPSLPNHLYTVAGSSGGWIWNMWQPPTPCSFRFRTLPDQLQAAGVGWGYYSGFDPKAFWLWNPLPGFATVEHSAAMRSHLATTGRFFRDLRDGRLPPVAWITPNKLESEHPPADIGVGMWYVTDLLNAIGKSPYWRDTLVVVTWDEYGGFYDGERPRQVNAFGLGFRVPALLVSPYVRPGRVDHTAYDFASVLKYADEVVHLPYLNANVAQARSIGFAIHTAQAPLPPPLVTRPVAPADLPAARRL